LSLILLSLVGMLGISSWLSLVGTLVHIPLPTYGGNSVDWNKHVNMI